MPETVRPGKTESGAGKGHHCPNQAAFRESCHRKRTEMRFFRNTQGTDGRNARQCEAARRYLHSRCCGLSEPHSCDIQPVSAHKDNRPAVRQCNQQGGVHFCSGYADFQAQP